MSLMLREVSPSALDLREVSPSAQDLKIFVNVSPSAQDLRDVSRSMAVGFHAAVIVGQLMPSLDFMMLTKPYV